MAVTPVPSNDVTRVRYPHVRLTDVILCIPELIVAGTALVNEPSGVGTPIADITVDNTSAGWDTLGIGLFTRITNGTTKRYELGTRRGNTSTLLRVPGLRTGDGGRANLNMSAIVNNDTVTVYDVVIPFAVRSRIDADTFELLKQWDVPYTDETIEPTPVANRGGAQWAQVDSGTGKATFNLDASDSYSFNGNPLNYDWSEPTGITITVGVNTDPAITVEADPGQYSHNLNIEDSVTGKTKSSVRWLYAVDGVTYKAFSQRYTIESITRDTSDRTGWLFQFTVVGSAETLPTEDNFLYVGAPVLFSYKYQFRESETDAWENLEDADGLRNFNGYITGFSEAVARGDGTFAITIDVAGTAYYYDRLPLATQVLIEDAAPAEWTEVDVALNNPHYGVYYCANEHSRSMARTAGLYDDDDFDTYRRSAFKIDAGKMLKGMQSVASLVPGGNVGSLPSGDLTLRKLINYQLTAYRSGLSNRFTFTAADIQSTDDTTPAEITYEWQPLPTYAEAEAGGFVWASGGATTAYKGRFGYLAPTQGESRAPLGDFIASSQTDILAIVGHHMAYMNRPLISFGWPIKFDLIEPARLEPVALDSSLANYWPMGEMPSQAVPLQVSRQWDLSVPGTPPRIEITFEPVTSGEPATLFSPESIGAVYDPPIGVACPTINLTWVSVGATPSGWTGLTGDSPFDPSPPFAGFSNARTFAGVRSGANQNWTRGGTSIDICGVMYTFSAACTLNTMSATYTHPGAANTLHRIFWAQIGGVWTVILNAASMTTSPTVVTYSGTPLASVTAVIYAAVHGSAANTPVMTVSKINA